MHGKWYRNYTILEVIQGDGHVAGMQMPTYVSRLAQRHESVHYAWLYMRPRHYVVIHIEINYV